MIQRVGRRVVAHHVAAVDGEPEFACAWIPVESHGVALAFREYLEAAAVRVHPGDVGVTHRIELADVARSADVHIQLAIRTERNEFAAVMRLARKPIGDDDRPRRIGEMPLDVVEAQDAIDRRNIERAVVKRDARRIGQPGRDDVKGRLALRS